MKVSVSIRWLTVGLLLWGCGGQGRDREDELGLDEKGGRRELVLVDQARTAPETTAGSDTAPLPRDTSAVSPAAAPAAGPDTSAGPDEPVAYDPHGEYTVQIGLYQDARSAARIVRQLSSEGYPAYAIAEVGKGGVRVRIGYFKTRSEAQRFGEIFRRDKGLEYWIDRRSGEQF